MKIVAISDVHARWEKLVIPECDLLISAGDYSFVGEQSVVRSFHQWLDKQPARHIISLQGNHEVWVEKNWDLAKRIALDMCPRVNFIDEGPLNILGYKIWCSAVTPYFHNWAWNRQPGPQIKKHWDRIPNDTEVLVTHGPPYGILDQVKPFKGLHLGCPSLKARLMWLSQLQLHVFGHIHSGCGIHAEVGPYERPVEYCNAAMCDESYKPTKQPWTLHLPDKD